MSVTQPAVIAIRDISYVMDCVREGRFEGKDLRALISTIRGLGERQAGIAAGMKRSLPWFSGSTFNQRRANDRFQAAWFMVFDIDHVEDIEGLKAKAVESLAFVRHAFQSVRDGVKLVAEFASPITREEDFRTIWKYLALRVQKSLQTEVDSTPDPARACFLSYDPELLTNPSCRPLDVKETLREAAAITELMRIFRPAPPCHSGVGASAPGAQESRPCGNSQSQTEAGSTQTQSGSTPFKGITQKGWIPGATASSRNDGAATSSDPTPSPSVIPAKAGIQTSSTHATNIQPSGNPETPSKDLDSSLRWNDGQSTPDDFEKASKIVQKLAQMRIPYSDWYRVGLALYAGFGEAGRPLWDLFLNNPHYQDQQWELDAKWRSFRNVREITLATLFEIGGRYGIN